MENRYFLFTKNTDNKLIDFIGPLFSDEIDECKEEEFEKNEIVESLDESLFKILYLEQYIEDFKLNWSDYVSYLIESMGLEFDIIASQEPDNEFEIDNEIIYIYGICKIRKDKNKLLIFIECDSDVLTIAKLILELQKYTDNIFDIEIVNKVYVNFKGEEYNNEEAVDAYETDKLFKTYLN